MNLDPERRYALRSAKLRALAIGDGGLLADGVDVEGDHLFDGKRLWILASETAPETALGVALLRADRHWSDELVSTTVCVDDASVAGVLARRATMLEPRPKVCCIDGSELVLAEPAEISTPLDALPPPEGFDDLCRGVGVEPLLEHGTWRGEILGLEVVRVAEDVESAADESPAVMVGVGRFDQEAGAMMRGGRSDSEALAAAADLVRAHRRPGAGAHPLATLARERWLRCDLCSDPQLIGLTDLMPVDPADERSNLRDPSPAPALGRGADGEQVLAVCSVGVDTRLIGAICELALRESPDRVLIVLPKRDVLEVLERVAGRFRIPTSIVGVLGSWEQG